MIYTDPTQVASAINEQIAAAKRILLLTHINPDGDAIGSLLGVWHALNALGKYSIPLASSALPSYGCWLPGVENVQVYQPGTELPEVDLIILADTASIPRVGAIYEDHADELARLPLIIIDHHVTNEGAGKLNLITPTAASTCELLYQLFRAMNVPISAELATCLLLGVTTDTQSFQTSSTTPTTMRVVAELLEHGADQQRVVHEVYYALPNSSASLMGMGLAALCVDGPLAWTTITQAMVRATDAEDEASDEVVRVMQRIAGVKALVLFKERVDGTTKISLRSRPPFDVATLAQRWGGGGHKRAAGATLAMPPAMAELEVLPLLRELVSNTTGD